MPGVRVNQVFRRNREQNLLETVVSAQAEVKGEKEYGEETEAQINDKQTFHRLHLSVHVGD